VWEKRSFGNLSSGEECFLYKATVPLTGLSVSITNYGLSLVSFNIPDGEECMDVLLGFDDVSGYEKHDFYSGCIVGRVASRIPQGKFTLDGKDHQLVLNHDDEITHLHGGFKGLSKVVWDCVIDDDKLKFSYVQPDGAEGYPGELTTSVTVCLRGKSVGGRVKGHFLSLDISATCTKPTPINITFHPYFNMDGHNAGSALDNKLTVFDYEGYLPMDPDTIVPTGSIEKTRDTPFKLEKTRIGDVIDDVPGGYDHTFAILCKEGYIIPGAEIESKDGKRKVKVLTDQPGMHVYSGNFLSCKDGKDGANYSKHGGIALEAQNFPNAVNTPAFPNSILRPGEEYKRNITFSFIFQL